MEFREYQEEIIDKSIPILLEHGFIYLAMEVRTGKTLTSLGIANAMWMKNVLFITKKKAITSIESDYKLLSPKYKLKSRKRYYIQNSCQSDTFIRNSHP